MTGRPLPDSSHLPLWRRDTTASTSHQPPLRLSSGLPMPASPPPRPQGCCVCSPRHHQMRLEPDPPRRRSCCAHAALCPCLLRLGGVAQTTRPVTVLGWGGQGGQGWALGVKSSRGPRTKCFSELLLGGGLMQGWGSKISPKYLSVVRTAGLRTGRALCALSFGDSAAPSSVLGLSPVSRNPLSCVCSP